MNDASSAARQARSRKARAEAGGRQVALFLTPKAAAKLDAMIARGETVTSAINGLLERSRK